MMDILKRKQRGDEIAATASNVGHQSDLRRYVLAYYYLSIDASQLALQSTLAVCEENRCQAFCVERNVSGMTKNPKKSEHNNNQRVVCRKKNVKYYSKQCIS